MNPTKCQHEHEIASAAERWEERYRTPKEDEREIDLLDSWKMTAPKMMLRGWEEIQKNDEHLEKEFKT